MQSLELLLHKVLDAVVVMRRDGTVADWNKCAEQIFGWTRDEALNRPMGELIIPALHREAHDLGLQHYLCTGEGPVMDRRIEITALDRGGREFPVELTITEADYLGEMVFLGFLRDISERKRAEVALIESEARLAATYNHALVGIGEADRKGRFLRNNEQFCRITGYSAEELQSRTIFDITHPEDLEQDRHLFEQQWSGELQDYTLEKRYIRKTGEIVWIELAASIVRGEAGASSYAIRIVRDITERKRAEDYQRLLTNELNHRVKNTLAVVQGLAQQTFKGGAVPPELMRAFDGRLAALSGAHNLLTDRSWEAAPMEQVIADALGPFRSSDHELKISGPNLVLPPQSVISLALAIHELATNAVKYGALSQPGGEVSVVWWVDGERLKLKWQERGGPAVSPPTRRGFGTRMLQQALAADLAGKVEIDFVEEGLICLLDAPLP